MKKIGVLGGMGPESTALFYQELIQQCQKQYGAKYDDDYPEIFINSLPIPDIVKSTNKTNKINKQLKNGIKTLKLVNAKIIAIPCNTIELFLAKIRRQSKIPILSIIEETVKKIEEKKYKTVGLLATETTINNKLYERYLNKQTEIIRPKNQDKISKIILNIMAGKKLVRDKKEIIKTINKLRQAGCETIILGCTDLPILIKQKDTTMPLINTIEVLAEATIKYANKVLW